MLALLLVGLLVGLVVLDRGLLLCSSRLACLQGVFLVSQGLSFLLYKLRNCAVQFTQSVTAVACQAGNSRSAGV